jgi:uncharacterized protein (TIGR03435 family)
MHVWSEKMKLLSLVRAGVMNLCFCSLLLAQTPGKLAFEVASIKPSPPLSTIISQAQAGKLDLGAMRIDGARLDLKFLSLSNMIGMAFKVKPHQISGPDWMPSQLFEIRAKLPEGGNKDQIPEMMQNLLAERFKLVFHRETKEQPVYALVVGKTGLKMKEVVEEAAAPASASDPAKTSAAKEEKGQQVIRTPEGDMTFKQEGNGMVMDAGKNGKMRMTMGENGSMRMEFAKMKMSEFADLLSQFTDRQVVDLTELKGSYEVALDLPLQDLLSLAKKMMPEIGALAGAGAAAPGGAAPGSGLSGIAPSDPSGGSILDAVQKLGLKLDPRKLPTEKLIIDSIEKTPTED